MKNVCLCGEWTVCCQKSSKMHIILFILLKHFVLNSTQNKNLICIDIFLLKLYVYTYIEIRQR